MKVKSPSRGHKVSSFRPGVLELERRDLLSIAPMVQATGAVSLSVDGIGSNSVAGAIVQVAKPAGATVRGAYLLSTTVFGTASNLTTGDVAIDGTTVVWNSVISNNISSSNAWADVTSLVKTKIDSAPAGRVDFTITEPLRSSAIDGEILAVIFDDPNVTTTNTVVLMFGAQNVAGDTFSLLLADPIDKTDPSLIVDMSLGISYSAQPGQYSQIDVNGARLTTAAGGSDDGGAFGGNGQLITVGGLDDTNANPATPGSLPTNSRSDDELYNLLPFINTGDTTITVRTLNPSNDDNIFFASFNLTTPAVVGEGIILSPGTTKRNTGANALVTATIQDDNGAPLAGTPVTFTVISGPNAGMTGTVTTGANGKAVFSYTSSFAGTDRVQASFVNSTSQTVTSGIVRVIWAGGVSLSQTDGSTLVAEAGDTDTYVVVLTSAPATDVVVNIDPGSQLAVDSTRLTFTTVNWNVPQTVTISAIDDAITNGDRLVLISNSVTSADANFNNAALTELLVTIIDDDEPGIVLGTDSLDLVEGGSSVGYTVRLASQPVANVTVTVNAGSQLTMTPSILVFTPYNWNIPRSVSARAVDDKLAEGDQSYTITIVANSTSATYNNVRAELPANIADNDFPTILVNQPQPGYLLEGTARIYTMTLSYPPTAPVTVTPLPDDGLFVSPSAMVFTRANWNIPHTLTIAALEDSDIQGEHTGVITHTVASDDPIFDGMAIDDVNLTILDNDGALVSGTAVNDSILVTHESASSQILVTLNNVVNSYPDSLSQLVLRPGGGDDSIQIRDVGIPIIVIGGSGKDNVIVAGLETNNAFALTSSAVSVNGAIVTLWEVENLIVAGNSGNDLFTVGALPGFTVDFRGGDGTDEVVGPHQVNTWNISAANTGTLNKTIKLTAVDKLTGGIEADTFWFSGRSSVSGLVDGGGGNDILDYTQYLATITVNLQTEAATATGGFTNITRVRGGRGSDKVIGPDQSNEWNVSSLNTGSVNGAFDFAGIENLTGGTEDDTFLLANLAGLKGRIDGGGGDDLLSYVAYQQRGVVVNLQTKAATGLSGWLNVEQFAGGAGKSDMFIGANQTNLWNLTEVNVGTINANGTKNGASFTGFENLTGGSGIDLFQLDMFGKWSGVLNGGSGVDTLEASAMTFNVYLVPRGSLAGTLNGRKFINLENRL